MSGLLVVTGGAGFVGLPTVRAALDAGWRVRVVDSLRGDVHADGRPPRDLEALADRDDVEVVVADVRDAGAADRALSGADAVVHLAAKVGLGVSFDDAPDYAASNGTGTACVLAAAARAGARRLVLASSMVVYGEGRYLDASRPDGPPRQPPPRRVEDLERGVFDPLGADGRPLVPVLVTEDAALEPRNVYAATKLFQEHLASSWARATGGTAALLRYHNVYGPGLPAGTPYAGVAALFLDALERGRAPRVFEDGGQRRDFVHVDDVAAANLAAVAWSAGGGPGERAGVARAFNVGSGEVRTVGDLASALARATRGPEPVVSGEYRLGDVRHVTASSERLRAETGWRPRVAFDDGVRQLVAARGASRVTVG
ncbi:NAD-dependent epimerase/dehydratase family protein [Luteimicrobium sp. NPDC057192]|uniref:NAD-dependent epimerase/dehydratase family protein n=1 Tax=Luteimicrobium sp. NPDC057192 TaxID=3346042 RepID=UPI00363C6678